MPSVNPEAMRPVVIAQLGEIFPLWCQKLQVKADETSGLDVCDGLEWSGMCVVCVCLSYLSEKDTDVGSGMSSSGVSVLMKNCSGFGS